MRHLSLLPCVLLALGSGAVHAQSSSIEAVGVDLEFMCESVDGGKTHCMPTAGKYGRYVDLANWRFVGGVNEDNACSFGSTYGYDKQAPWVSGDCSAVFRAPNLRYGDEHNAKRLDVENSRLGSSSSMLNEASRNEGPGCFSLCWKSEVSDRHFDREKASRDAIQSLRDSQDATTY